MAHPTTPGEEYQKQMLRLERLRRDCRRLQLEDNDPLIGKDIYAPSKIDVMNMLLQVRSRPDPKIQLGNVDSNVALVLVDADLPDHPIIYYSEPFSLLTGYFDHDDLIGRNCRFLQNPPDGRVFLKEIQEKNHIARREIKEKLEVFQETQVTIINFRKDGTPFINVLTIVPFVWEKNGTSKNYVFGFQADEATLINAKVYLH